MDKAVVIVSVAGEEQQPIPQYWGNSDVVESVRRVLDGADIACHAVTVSEPSEVVPLRSPKHLFFPNARYFRTKPLYLSALFDRWRLGYIGSSRAGHENESKSRMKRRLQRHLIPTPDFRLISGDHHLDVLESLRTPYVLKPDAGTESYGVIRVDDPRRAPHLARSVVERFGWPLIVETWSRAREFTVAVIGNPGERYAFPVEIVVPDDADYLTEDLKRAGASETTKPVTDKTLRESLVAMAVTAADCLLVRDCVRMEILMDETGRLSIIDVNTLPGLRPGPHHKSYLLSCLSTNLGFRQAETVLAIIAAACLRLSFPLSRRLSNVWTEISRGTP